MAKSSVTRPTQQAIADRYGLRKNGDEFHGPCPVCGGEDRFYVRSGGSFGCRQCPDSKALFSHVMKDLGFGVKAKPQVQGKRACTWNVIATYEHVDGHTVAVKRCDGDADHKKHFANAGLRGGGWLVKLWGDYGGDVVLVEGEKSAAAVRAAGFVAATWPRGAGNEHLADFSPLKGRRVIGWPDNDAKGKAAMERALTLALTAGAMSASLVDVAGLPRGDDAADMDEESRASLIDTAEPWTPPQPKGSMLDEPRPGQGVVFEPDHAGLVAALHYQQLELCLNTRVEGVYIRRTDHRTAGDWYKTFCESHPGDGWVPLKDVVESRLRTHIAETFHMQGPRGLKPLKFSREDFNLSVLSHVASRRRDPVREWLGSLPKWDGVDRTSMLFVDCLGADNTPLTRAMARCFMIAAVRRTLKPGCKHDLVPVLVGEQGAGKSTFCRSLLPPDHQEGHGRWFTDSVDLSETTQKQVEAVGPAVIVEFSDLKGIHHARLEALKAFLSRQEDRYRLPYRQYADDLPRHWVAIGTANDDGTGVLPGDPSGNRRFVAIRVSTDGPAAVRKWLHEHRAQLWAEAMAAEAAGEQHWLPEGLEIEQREHNRAFERSNEALGDIGLRLTEKYADTRDGLPMATLLIESRLVDTEADAASNRKAQMALASQLREFQWERGTFNNRKVWIPPKRKPAAPAAPPLCTQCEEIYPEREGVPLCNACIDQFNRENRDKALHIAPEVRAYHDIIDALEKGDGDAAQRLIDEAWEYHDKAKCSMCIAEEKRQYKLAGPDW